jgi:hypothetical protein
MPKLEPVRWYGIFTAVLALSAHYVDIPTPLFLAVGAAVLGVGVEATRGRVSPTATPAHAGPVDQAAA